MTVQELRDLVTDITARRALNLVNGTPRKEVVELIVKLKVDQRLYLIGKENVNSLWASIRENPTVTDFVMMGSAEMRARIGSLQNWNRLVEDLAYGYSINMGTSNGKSCVDDDLFSRLSNYAQIKQLLENNGWLVFVLILETLEFQPSTPQPDTGTTAKG